MTGYVDYEGFWVEDPPIPDPPYVNGDHAARCRGYPPCIEAEDAYFAERAARNAATG